jgi:hypothetical protein
MRLQREFLLIIKADLFTACCPVLLIYHFRVIRSIPMIRMTVVNRTRVDKA